VAGKHTALSGVAGVAAVAAAAAGSVSATAATATAAPAEAGFFFHLFGDLWRLTRPLMAGRLQIPASVVKLELLIMFRLPP